MNDLIDVIIRQCSSMFAALDILIDRLSDEKLACRLSSVLYKICYIFHKSQCPPFSCLSVLYFDPLVNQVLSYSTKDAIDAINHRCPPFS